MYGGHSIPCFVHGCNKKRTFCFLRNRSLLENQVTFSKIFLSISMCTTVSMRPYKQPLCPHCADSVCQVTLECRSWLLNGLSVCTSAVYDALLGLISSNATHIHMIMSELMWPNYWSKIKSAAQTLRPSINAPNRLLIPLSWRGFTAPLVAGWLNYRWFSSSAPHRGKSFLMLRSICTGKSEYPSFNCQRPEDRIPTWKLGDTALYPRSSLKIESPLINIMRSLW